MPFIKKHFLLFFLFFSFVTQAQSNAELNARLIDGLEKYRHELLAGDEAKVQTLNYLKYLWQETDGKYGSQITDLLLKVVYRYQFANADTAVLSETIRKRYPHLVDLGAKVLRDIDLIIDNQDFIDLLALRVLNTDPPFEINAKTDVFEEIAFYSIKSHQKIGEIGAGGGTWSCIAGITFDSLDIYVNEIRETMVESAKRKITSTALVRPGNQFHFVLGYETSTGMEGENLDKIVIRNSFHHFAKKKQMLASIKKSLAPGGSLYIFDPVVFPNKKNRGCPDKLTAKKIKKVIQKNGFDIVELRFTANWKWILLHCKPSYK